MTDPSHDADSNEGTAHGPVWSFRGYRISPSEFTTAMAHFYRGEMSRSNTWRTRLDSTTNWAVVTTAAALTFAFGAPSNPHFMVLFVMMLVILFLYIEARRYRYYELWTYRVRLMETDFFAAMLVPPFAPGGEWAERLAESLLDPAFPISGWEAIGRRLRRNYLWILALLSLSWAVKVALHPIPLSTGAEFLERAGIGPISGWWTVAGVVLLNCTTLLLGLATARLQQAAGEVLPQGPGPWQLRRWLQALQGIPGEIFPSRRLHRAWPRVRRERLSIIITSQGEALARRLMDELRHGVTALPGTGMYTGDPRSVLLCAIHPTEVHQLRAIVQSVDPQAFLVINPAQEVVGRGFDTFRERSRRTHQEGTQ